MLFVISGPSGVGKSTILRRLVAETPNLSFAVSHTTRPPREGEVQGRDYHFVRGPEFDRLVAARAFVEWASVHGRRYGTSRDALRSTEPGDLLIEVDVQGAVALRERVPEAVTIFIEPPHFDDLEIRLADRGRDTHDEIRTRLDTARREMLRADSYDHRVVNRDLEETVADLAAVIVKRRASHPDREDPDREDPDKEERPRRPGERRR